VRNRPAGSQQASGSQASGPLIALLTDFGLQDTYVGVMKGVIAGIAPQTRITDLLHTVRPQDVAHGAFALLVSAPYFPPGTIFVAVVDPGVGSSRRPIAVQAGGYLFVAPDNGLLSYVLERFPPEAAVVLEQLAFRLPYLSNTFHGRDIFAPAAAHLATGVALPAFGPPLDPNQLVRLPPLAATRQGSAWAGRVLHIDHFGNLITSLDARTLGLDSPSPAVRRCWRVAVGGQTIRGLSTTFAEVAIGESVMYIGSDDFIEVGVRNGHAASAFGITVGDPVRAWQASESEDADEYVID
jgi:S-adenosylmethionine hydrolase